MRPRRRPGRRRFCGWAPMVVGALVPLVCCVLARKKGDAAVWKAFGAVAVVAGVVGAIRLRVAFTTWA